jgi:hypothetical protein
VLFVLLGGSTEASAAVAFGVRDLPRLRRAKAEEMKQEARRAGRSSAPAHAHIALAIRCKSIHRGDGEIADLTTLSAV